jgi:hypothetical protein
VAAGGLGADIGHGLDLHLHARIDQCLAKHSSQAAPLDAGLIALTGRFVSEVRKALS